MTLDQDTVRLTVAQAIVRYLMNQFIQIDGEKLYISGGGFGIFGHGNLPCLGEALYRGQNEQSMVGGRHARGVREPQGSGKTP